MRMFTCPAAYLTYVEDAIDRALREVKLDASFRANEDEYVRDLATIPDRFVAPGTTGRLLILVSIPNDEALATPLHAITATAR